MVRQLKYAMECKEGYSPGKEDEYVRCILQKSQEFASRNPRGGDKQTVRRATKALVKLQKQNPTGVSRKPIRSQAGFTSYPGKGIWPWQAKYGGLEVVEEHQGCYRIVDKFYPALCKVLSPTCGEAMTPTTTSGTSSGSGGTNENEGLTT